MFTNFITFASKLLKVYAKMKDKLKKLSVQAWVAIALSFVAAGSFIAGLIIPPPGVIDNSVLKGMGEIIGIIAIFFAWDAVSMGLDTKLKHGDTELHITSNDNNNQE